MAQCKTCKVEIAWKRLWVPSQKRSAWVPHEPQRDEAGAVVYATVPNGKGTQTRRAVPSDNTHRCGTPAPVPPEQPTPPEPTPAPPEQPQTPPAPEPESPPWRQYPVPFEADAIKGVVRAEMKAILDEYGIEQPARVLRVEVDGKSYESDGEVIHPSVDRLIHLTARGVHTYLWGPAGGGKTFGAMQAARLIGRESVVITMPGLTHAKLLGYTKPDGTMIRTAFVDAFEFGKVAILDEFDRCLPAVAAAFNSILENKVYVEGSRVIPMHPDFRVIATGNTDMRGATRTFTSAQPLDLATAARFAFVAWPYDEKHEDQMVRTILPVPVAKTLLSWVRKVRAMMVTDRIDTAFCGPREAIRIAADVKAGTPVDVAVESWVWRGLDPATVARIVAKYPYPVLTEVGK